MEMFMRGSTVMYVLFAVSVIALAISIEKFLFFIFIRGNYKKLIERVEKKLIRGDKKQAHKVVSEANGPVCRVINIVIKNWDKKADHLHEIVNFEAKIALDELEKHLRGLSVIAQTAPLLGLLGTVSGMIRTFVEIENMGGQIQVAGLAGGIWEALSTTAFGLAIAIPVIIIFNYFEAKVDNYINTINYCAQRLLRLHEEKR